MAWRAIKNNRKTFHFNMSSPEDMNGEQRSLNCITVHNVHTTRKKIKMIKIRDWCHFILRPKNVTTMIIINENCNYEKQ